MRRLDVLLALAVVLVWGGNFVAIDEGLRQLPPLLFVAIRFLLTALPAVLFVPRPNVGWRSVVALGLLMCVGQFGLLFVAMSEGMPAGLASVVMQTQALFTMVFATVLLRERPRPVQVLGLTVAAGGLLVIGLQRGTSVPGRAMLLLLGGGACWGAANIVTRRARSPRPFSLLVYSALVAPVPLLGLSLLREGAHRDARALASLQPSIVWSMGFVVVLATFFGFGAWYWLLGRYESSAVAPFSLLVPVSGLSSAWLLLGERPTLAQIAGSAVAVSGVALIVHGARRPVPVAAPHGLPTQSGHTSACAAVVTPSGPVATAGSP